MRSRARDVLIAALLAGMACGRAVEVTNPPTFSPLTSTLAATLTIEPTPTASTTATPTETPTPTSSPLPTVASLNAQVTADLLSCRYGPGPEYLYLYGLRKTANIQLIGRTDGENWNWVYVDGRNPCWVNTKFLSIEGDWRGLPIVYPVIAKIPRSPYYQPTDWVGATRSGNEVEVAWHPIRLRAGDEEDESMLLYIVEIWRCEGGELLFEPLATNETAVKFVDEPGCDAPSHGRHYFQEKHGYAGPVEIPWPDYESQ